MSKSPWFWLAATLVVIAAFTTIGPAEKTLGVNVRIVYLHGAWVWAALVSFAAAAVAGLAGLLARKVSLQRWSCALGRTGLFFWISYLPISMWAMQTNWNGLFLVEPRFRVAVIFSIGGLLLQIGVTIAGDLAWASVANLLYFAALAWVLSNTPNVMHPGSPIMNSEARHIQLFFLLLLGIVLLLVIQISRLFYQFETLHPLADRHLYRHTAGN
jgi:hypothetical protein